jgi:hypothetical protein
MLEKEIEKAVSAYAKKQGILNYKFVSPGHRSVPDRIFITSESVIFFVEFKRDPSCVATPKQLREHERLRAKGCKVYVIDNVTDGFKLIDLYLH